ncbi:MAG: methyltransferase domain-containing protein [Candidatus Bathyarchaeia archaeon]|jgi:hypothetical protein
MTEAMGNEQSGIHCSLCGSSGLWVFYEVTDVPASCNLLWRSKDEAINCPKGNIKLAFCPFCTFVTNIAVEPEKNQYGHRYDDSLFYSPHFQDFARKLAINLIQRYDLHNKSIIEIGGGKVDFLSLLIELGNNHGLRFDPFLMKVEDKSRESVESIPSFYPQLDRSNKADFVFSYCELEHMNYPKNFLSNLRKIFGCSSKTHVFFAVPNALKAFEEGDFTNIIYEHVSYFTIPSLFHLFSSCGFNISEVTESKNGVFDSIYIDATPKTRMKSSFKPHLKPEAGEIKDGITSFAAKSTNTIEKYSSRLKQLLNKGKRVVIWGAGSRGVTLLNILKDPRIEYAVDINPRKQGKYVPGTGQKIVEPKFLLTHQPDYIILANAAYENEIRHIISNLEIKTEFIQIQHSGLTNCYS